MPDFQADLPIFHGPLDLLLYLVKRDELDLLDIPIARVAEQFLQYLDVLQVIDVEQAGEFLVMAATLMELKSKVLLPRTEEADQPQEDPRQELVRQLLEYKRFKEAAALLEQQAERQASRSEEHTSELQSQSNLVCRLLLEKKKKTRNETINIAISAPQRANKHKV